MLVIKIRYHILAISAVSKYTFLLFKTLLFTTFLGNSQKILGNDELNAVDLNKIENKVQLKQKIQRRIKFMIG